MNEKDIYNDSPRNAQIHAEQNRLARRKIIVLVICICLSILISNLLNNPCGNYLPTILITTFEWYRSYPREKRSYYGLCRLLFFILTICLWVVFALKIIIENVAALFGYHHVQIDQIQHLFPYTLAFIMLTRRRSDMDLNDKRRYLIHLLFDVPAFFLVLMFKLINHPFNCLYSQITDCCYLGCLPTALDVPTLNNIKIRYVVNMCAEYNGPCRTYEKYGIKQLHLPVVDGTSPSVQTIRTAIKFMKEAYNNHEKIFVHCKFGMSRSATIVFCHLIANECITPESALRLMKERRPEVSVNIVNSVCVKQFLASLERNNT